LYLFLKYFVIVVFTFIEKWNTNDVMTTEASISGLLPGVKVTTDGTFDRKKQ